MLEAYKQLQNNTPVPSVQDNIKQFYAATTLAERLMAMAVIRFAYEAEQMKANIDSVPMLETTNKLVGEFHRISTTVASQEMGTMAEHLNKVMEKTWNIYMESMLPSDAMRPEPLMSIRAMLTDLGIKDQ